MRAVWRPLPAPRAASLLKQSLLLDIYFFGGKALGLWDAAEKPQKSRSARHSAEPRSCGTGGPAPGTAGPPPRPPHLPAGLFRPRRAYVVVTAVHSHVRAPLASLPGKGSSPQTVPPVTRGHGCLRQRRPRAGGARQGGERGERGGEPRPSPVGCLVLTLPSRLRHLVCCYATFPLPLPIPPFKSQALQGEDAVGKWDQLLPHVLGFVHSPSSTTCTLSAPFA